MSNLSFVQVFTTKTKWMWSSSFLTDRQGKVISFQSQNLKGITFLIVFSLNVRVPPTKTNCTASGTNFWCS